MAVNINFSTTELNTPDGIERVLRRFAQAISPPPKPPSPLDPSALALELAPFIKQQLQFNGIAPLNLQSLLPDIGGGVLVGTHAERLTNYNSNNYDIGQLFYETDRTVFYINRLVSGSKVWRWAANTYSNTLANIVTDLGTNDTGFLYDVTDYEHLLEWTGSAWTWGPDELGSGYYQLFEDAPNTIGTLAWQICDGSTVARLNANAGTTNVTVPDVTTPVYLKGGLTSAAIAAASGTTADESAHVHSVDPPSTATGAPSATTTVNGVGAQAVASDAHTHTVDIAAFDSGTGSAHNHGPGTLELRNKRARLYYRR